MLYEAKGYRRLIEELGQRQLEYDRIMLIPEEAGCKTPDWAAFCRGTPIAVLEVKTVYESDEQSKYVHENTRRIRERGEAILWHGSTPVPAAFESKLRKTAAYAKQQLDGYAPGASILRIAFLIVHFDHDLTGDSANYATVGTFLNRLNDGMFHVASEIRR